MHYFLVVTIQHSTQDLFHQIGGLLLGEKVQLLYTIEEFSA